MDAAHQNKKAALRSMMKTAAMRKEKRIDSPLVRYNDSGLPVCKVCVVVIKSEGVWTAHLASKSHKEAVENLKRKAKSSVIKKESTDITQNPAIHDSPVPAATSASNRKSASLPSNFFDNPPNKTMKLDNQNSGGSADAGNSQKQSTASEPVQNSAPTSVLPEGFFDNKTDDKKARGEKTEAKVDMKDELKEFEKAVMEELTVAALQQEEEDEELAEAREEEEAMVQKSLAERVETLRRKKEEKLAALEQKVNQSKDQTMPTDNQPGENNAEHSEEEEEEDSDDAELLGVGLMNWRARQL